MIGQCACSAWCQMSHHSIVVSRGVMYRHLLKLHLPFELFAADMVNLSVHVAAAMAGDA